MNLLRLFICQILDALIVLRDANVVHCDLKPENILLKSLDSGEIKVIDYGSACFENRTVYSYIQSRFYRSPEVLLGYPYNAAIDMWSVGCVAAELFLGLPLFPGASEFNLLQRIHETLGQPPDFIVANSTSGSKFFKRLGPQEEVPDGANRESSRYRLLSQDEFEAQEGAKVATGKRYFKYTALQDIIGRCSYRQGLSEAELARERQQRAAFLDFLLGVLQLDPSTRWTPRQAAQHPFITNAPFTGPFQPPPDPVRTVPPPVSYSRSSQGCQYSTNSSHGASPHWARSAPTAMPSQPYPFASPPSTAHGIGASSEYGGLNVDATNGSFGALSGLAASLGREGSGAPIAIPQQVGSIGRHGYHTGDGGFSGFGTSPGSAPAAFMADRQQQRAQAQQVQAQQDALAVLTAQHQAVLQQQQQGASGPVFGVYGSAPMHPVFTAQATPPGMSNLCASYAAMGLSPERILALQSGSLALAQQHAANLGIHPMHLPPHLAAQLAASAGAAGTDPALLYDDLRQRAAASYEATYGRAAAAAVADALCQQSRADSDQGSTMGQVVGGSGQAALHSPASMSGRDTQDMMMGITSTSAQPGSTMQGQEGGARGGDAMDVETHADTCSPPPDPGDWDPLYSEEQLLHEDSPGEAGTGPDASISRAANFTNITASNTLQPPALMPPAQPLSMSRDLDAALAFNCMLFMPPNQQQAYLHHMSRTETYSTHGNTLYPSPPSINSSLMNHSMPSYFHGMTSANVGTHTSWGSPQSPRNLANSQVSRGAGSANPVQAPSAFAEQPAYQN